MDLSEYDTIEASEEGQIMQVMNPFVAGEPLEGVLIRVAGIDSEKFKKAERASLDRRLNTGGRRGGSNVKAIEIENDAIETLVAATIGWEGVELDGHVVEFSPANVRKIYRRLPWLKEQVDTFCGNRANFKKASLKT